MFNLKYDIFSIQGTKVSRHFKATVKNSTSQKKKKKYIGTWEN